jgi:hypothetical protein
LLLREKPLAFLQQLRPVHSRANRLDALHVEPGCHGQPYEGQAEHEREHHGYRLGRA